MKLADPPQKSQCLVDGAWIGEGVDAIYGGGRQLGRHLDRARSFGVKESGFGREDLHHGAEEGSEFEHMLMGLFGS